MTGNGRLNKTKIAVVGNCQARSVASLLSLINSSVEAKPIRTNRIDEEARLSIRDADHVFAHVDAVPYLQSTAHRGALSLLPRIAFAGFHPDITYLRADGKRLNSPTGEWHSFLVYYAWKRGMRLPDALSLFSDDVFAALGYGDRFKSATQALVTEGNTVGIALGPMVDSWTRRGCFMFGINHPKLYPLSDVAKTMLRNIGIEVEFNTPEDCVPDPLSSAAIWPVYPYVAKKLGLQGSYTFKMAKALLPAGVKTLYLDLPEYVERALAVLSTCDPNATMSLAAAPRFIERLDGLAGAPRTRLNVAPKARNPYSELPDHHFWSRSVARIAREQVDPIVSTKFGITKTNKIATAGSCFAQHLSNTLRSSGYHFYVVENANDLPREVAVRRNFGVFSARYGNVYTARQLLQLFQRAYGKFDPSDRSWFRADQRFVDPFRPEIEPDGFETEDAVIHERLQHFTAVRYLFETVDVFVFTLGLTESWRSREDGAVFPLAPGVVAGSMDTSRYEFVNFSAADVHHDLITFADCLTEVNPTAKILLTVSPVPLIATYEAEHVLAATTYSKSVLRVAAQEVANRRNYVAYFPSFEIVTGAFNRGAYFGSDLRSVTAEGVAHVMRTFLKHYGDGAPDNLAMQQDEIFDIVCEEEEIENSR